MNFEDMQAAWKEQHPGKTGTQATSLDAKLLGRIRRNQRGYARTMVLMVFGQVVALGVGVEAIIFEASVGPHTPLRIVHEYYLSMGAGIALLVGLTFVLGRRAPGMYSIRADRSGLSLGDLIHRDARRYRFGQILGDGNQFAAGLLQMALVIVIASRFGLHGPLRWIALGLVAVPMLDVLAHRISLRSLRPKLGQSLSDVLMLSIRQSQSRARWAEHLWRQTALNLAGIFLSMEPLWIDHGAVRPATWVMLLIFVLVVALVRTASKKMVRRLLQPRIEELDSLRAGLAEGCQAGGPR